MGKVIGWADEAAGASQAAAPTIIAANALLQLDMAAPLTRVQVILPWESSHFVHYRSSPRAICR